MFQGNDMDNGMLLPVCKQLGSNCFILEDSRITMALGARHQCVTWAQGSADWCADWSTEVERAQGKRSSYGQAPLVEFPPLF